jgi:hypothetical protein
MNAQLRSRDETYGQNGSAPGAARKFVVDFSESAYQTLLALAESKATTVSGVLRDAIALEKWLQDTVDNGDKVFVVTRNGALRQVVPL